MARRSAILVLLGVSVVPTSAGVLAALWSGLDSAALARVLATPGVGLSIASSVWSGVIATGVSLVLAHLAIAVAVSGNWQKRLSGFALPILAMPHLALGIGLALLLAPSGVLLRALSPWATGFELPPDWLTVQDPAGLSLMLGLVVKETCFLIMALMAALAQVPAAKLQLQARALGYGPLKAWLSVTAPLLQQQIRLPLAAVLVFGISNVELAIPLGPGLPPTFSVMLWRWFTDPDPVINAQAYAGTVLLLLATATALAFAAAAGALVKRLLGLAAESGRRRERDRLARGTAQSLLLAGWLLGILAIAAILLRSAAGPWRFPALLPGGDWLSRWLDVLPVAGDVAATTVGLAMDPAVGHSVPARAAGGRAMQTRPACSRYRGRLAVRPVTGPTDDFSFWHTGTARPAARRRHAGRGTLEPPDFCVALPLGPAGPRAGHHRSALPVGRRNARRAALANLAHRHRPPARAIDAARVRAGFFGQRRAVSAHPVRRCGSLRNGRNGSRRVGGFR